MSIANHVISTVGSVLTIAGFALATGVSAPFAVAIGLASYGAIHGIVATFEAIRMRRTSSIHFRLVEKETRRATTNAGPRRLIAIALAVAIIAGAAATASILRPSKHLATATHPSGAVVSAGIANVAEGDVKYQEMTDVRVDEVVRVQLLVRNPNSHTLHASSVDFSFEGPQDRRQRLAWTYTEGRDEVKVEVGVTLSTDSAAVRPILGSVVLKATSTGGGYEESALPEDAIFNWPLDLPDIPAHKEVSVTVLLRSFAREFSVNLYTKAHSNPDWQTEVEAQPGETVDYRLVVRNRGNEPIQSGTIYVNLPPGTAYVPGTTETVIDGARARVNDGIVDFTSPTKSAGDGLSVGSIGVGETLEAVFSVEISPLALFGQHLRAVGVFRPSGGNEYYSTAGVTVRPGSR